ncbi:MAG: hypothetical protein WC655_05905, partial [Candidatus Hydrogenedentales bacterium]
NGNRAEEVCRIKGAPDISMQWPSDGSLVLLTRGATKEDLYLLEEETQANGLVTLDLQFES